MATFPHACWTPRYVGQQMPDEPALFRLTTATSFAELNEIDVRPEGHLRITVAQSSAVAPLAEGAFLAQVRSMIEARMTLTLVLGFPASRYIEERRYVGNDRFLSTLPGYFLVAAAREVIDSTGHQIRSELLRCIWAQIVDRHGILLRGPRYSIVARESDSPIPPILGGGQHFPNAPAPFRDVFQRALREVGGGHLDLSTQQEYIVSYLYEIAQNAHEHGRAGPDGRIRKGVRGISFERIVFNRFDEALHREEFPLEVAMYFAKTRSVSDRHLFYACTISDLGQGIHNTMPLAGTAPAIELLNRAFLTGEGRKQKEGQSAEGAGLPYVYGCATALKALLFVKSAELYAVKDFSDVTSQNFVELSMRGVPLGTSISLVWPHQGGREDQLQLVEP